MKIINLVIITLLLINLQACSEDSPAPKANAENDQQASVSNNKILYPDGEIKDAVLGELKHGRWELVMFWATYCSICKKDFEKLAKFIDDNPEISLTIVGVVVDGIEEKDKAITQIHQRYLDYAHVITDFDQGNKLYQEITDTPLLGVPSQLLYNTQNELVGFSRHAIDTDALELMVYDES